MGSTREERAAVGDDPDATRGGQPEGPAERLSWARLGILVLVIGLIAGGGVLSLREVSSADPPVGRSWSVPYVDVTLTPTYEFQDPQSNPARDIALAFVVSDPEQPCVPSWGGAYTLDEASRELELDRRITQLRAAGGDIMVSFGGQANDELAFRCEDEALLLEAYRSVVERYDVDVIDLDIENDELRDEASIARRARAVAALQAELVAAGEELAVWLTVPVATDGLTADGVDLVAATLEGGVDLTGVNVMTMNFSDGSPPTADMLAATTSALEATAVQVADVYGRQGRPLDEWERWARLGATPMIGQNDVDGEAFTLDDARGLADFAEQKGLGRVSTWSLNRDEPCSASFADVVIHSNTCSGVAQEPLEFAEIFTALPGRPPSAPATDAVTIPDRVVGVDDPATSPYPIWRPDAQYPEGYKVVRQGLVYQAKWYTQGQDPSMTVANPWDTPWSLIGPVDPDDAPMTPSTLPPGTHPEWDPMVLYGKGQRVLLAGLPFEARWPNQGDIPPMLFPVGPDAAWSPLFTVPGEPSAP